VIAEGGPYHANDPAYVIGRCRATGRGHFADWLEKHGGLPRDEVEAGDLSLAAFEKGRRRALPSD
jgi:hypothetical protein